MRPPPRRTAPSELPPTILSILTTIPPAPRADSWCRERLPKFRTILRRSMISAHRSRRHRRMRARTSITPTATRDLSRPAYAPRQQRCQRPRWRGSRCAAAERPAGPAFGPALAPSSNGAAPLEFPSAEGRHGGRADGSSGANNSPFGAEPSATSSVLKRGTTTNALRPLSNDAPPLDALSTAEGTGHPGTKQLEGAQSPRLTIEKIVPAEVQVGKSAKFVIKVRNEGSVAAQGVEIHDDVPKGTQLVSTTPAASQGARGELVYLVALGTLQAGPASDRRVGTAADCRRGNRQRRQRHIPCRRLGADDRHAAAARPASFRSQASHDRRRRHRSRSISAIRAPGPPAAS